MSISSEELKKNLEQRKNTERIKQLLLERVAEVAPHLFPNGKKKGNHWCVGSIDGETGNSFDICIAGEKAGLYGDFADSEKHSRNLLDLWMRARKVDFKTAKREAAEWLGEPLHGAKPASAKPTPSKEPFDWEPCVRSFTDEWVEQIARWRGISVAFLRELRECKEIGAYQGKVAFPVREGGVIVGAHYRVNDDNWYYAPSGFVKAAPMIFGEMKAGADVQFFESTWDGLDYMDKTGARSGVFITRGSGNGKFAALIPERCTVYAWKQNDIEKDGKNPADEWLKSARTHAHKSCTLKLPKIPRHDFNDWTRAGASSYDILAAKLSAEPMQQADGAKPEVRLIEFKSPLELKNFVPPPGIHLVGDYHIVKGSVFVEGGPPGVGKSRGLTALAIAGATVNDWFGYKVHRQFKTLIVQAENGEFRLAREFAELDCDALEDFVRICPPPPYGFCFKRQDFRKELADAIADFKPDLVGFDPWNAAAREQDSREYLDTFDALKSVLPTGDDAPALGIVAHTRKPKTDERHSGRALLNLLAGSYVLGSVPRTVFVMQAASDDVTDNRVVWTCCKNNDGELGNRSAWERRGGLFLPVEFFDFDAFDHPPKEKRGLQPEELREFLKKGGQYEKGQLVSIIMEETGCQKTAAYSLIRKAVKKGAFA